MVPVSVCINTQTPLLQFPRESDGRPALWELEPDISKLEEGVDYRFSPGGVTRMVYPLARRMLTERVWRNVHWVALNAHAPETVRLPGGITLHNIAIEKIRLGGYGKAKEAIWSTVHGLSPTRSFQDLFWTDDYGEYTYYNRVTSELIRDLDRAYDFDLFYIHDFQQLPIGQMLGTLKPKVFRWHIPFDPRKIPAQWGPLLSTYLNSYDVVVVSSERYRAALRRFGHRGRVERMYPYIDPAEYGRADAAHVAEVSAKFGIAEDDLVVLVVARMDPAKAQDRVIAAIARLRPKFPRLRLVLAGNGSFTGAASGLGLSKSETWRSYLEEFAVSLGIRDRVVFTGHISQRELEALYERCSFTVLPSVREGFGLVVVESWLFEKPTIVSVRAGVADLVRDGENGLLFDPGNSGSLDRQMRRLLRDPGATCRRLGEAGHTTARLCTLSAAVRHETRLTGEFGEG
jgi:glycosyltransferase involved in cell wall biosynthesis